MKTNQPVWKLVANLGDVNALDYGGLLIWEDTTGVYPPEAELIELDDSDDDDSPLTVYRFILEPCTYANGTLSDNPFHPAHPVWFADRLGDVAQAMDFPIDELIAGFLSGDAVVRAHSWRAVLDYFGPDEFDSYPCHYSRWELVGRLWAKTTPAERAAAHLSLPRPRE